MITISTGDLLGLLTDVMPLATDSKDSPQYGVLLEWTDAMSDGGRLRAHATNGGLTAGVSSWDPDDREIYVAPDEFAYVPGRSFEDEPAWRAFIAMPDVAEIVKTFKLPAKFLWIPLRVKVNDTGTRLIIERSRDTGKTQHLMTVQPTGTEAAVPDIDAMVEGALHRLRPRNGIKMWGHRIAAFANASRRGPLDLTFTNAGPVVVRVGDRFAGTLTAEKPERSASVLRDGAGVMVGAS
jgi:hypothetical protein